MYSLWDMYLVLYILRLDAYAVCGACVQNLHCVRKPYHRKALKDIAMASRPPRIR